MTRVLVAGGAGFIGSHLCERLLAEGREVMCVDDFSTGARANVATLTGRPCFNLLEHDVTEPFEMDVDEIYNFACPAAPVHYRRDPVRTLRTSVLGSLQLLGLARKNGARILLASTSEVYGDPAVHPQPETYRGNVNPVGPRACYEEGKRAAETLFSDFRRAHGVETCIARIFNTYGPRLRPDDGRVIPAFVLAALRKEALSVHGDGSQTRSFCFVDDLVEGLVRLMAKGAEGPVNLGNPEEISILDLARKICDLLAAPREIRHLPAVAEDPRRRRPDISLARSILGWEPAVPLDEGLERTLAFFR